MFLQTERNKYLCLLVLVIFAAMLTGCGDRSELENNAYVIAIGIDKAKKKDAVQISFLIANPEYGSQQEGASTDEPPVELISFEANDVSTARNLANTVIAKKNILQSASNDDCVGNICQR
ncbi:hypothetical protein RWE15_19980 [Virgibacillus halophilus]|uniref:Spore germination protein N-terminal domain-containing protein n=1 Tax=Tigheibacillus halophilus TaxID=361280 RepID=A0ABU5CAH1_9BACI|nr:hypothetical protein [Virgibacillus halophilus]